MKRFLLLNGRVLSIVFLVNGSFAFKNDLNIMGFVLTLIGVFLVDISWRQK